MKVEANGNILIWAREEANLSVDFVAERLGKKETDIINWENEVDHPTYNQLERLAYELYKKPLAVFFFPQPPLTIQPKKSFRTLTDKSYNKISYKVIRLINEALVKQINLYELNNNINPAKTLITRHGISRNYFETAKKIRLTFDVNILEQQKQKSPDDAFEFWRQKFSDFGIYIFKGAFEDNNYSGFCIHDELFPVIYVNNSMAFTRQIFTLFHELYHLLSGTSGIDKIDDNYLYELSNDNRDVEINCNAFAGEFLVPSEDFDKRVNNKKVDIQLIENLAKLYCVSREVILRKMLNKHIVSQEYYEKKTDEFKEDYLRSNKENRESGGNYFNTKISYLGNQYLNLVFKNYYMKKFDSYQLSKYLGVKIDYIPKIESRLARRRK